MSTTPAAPTPGHYHDSLGTRYAARLDKRTGWWLQKLRPPGSPQPEPFSCPGFPSNVTKGLFTLISPQPPL